MTEDETAPAREAFEQSLASARPLPESALARRLRMEGVLASVLGRPAELPRVGRYVLERQVGAGGMGVVFQGCDPAQNRRVAIKVLSDGAQTERARFLREAEILRSLSHPHVVRYLDHGTGEEGVPFLVMEWLDGCDLASRLRRGPLGIAEALSVTLCAAQALAAAHEAGVTHRDVKPSNVFLVGERIDSPRLIDFGIARSRQLTQPGARLTVTGAVLGSPHYMAPEQLRGEHDPRTDVYGLGATLYECLTGQPPFRGEHPAAVLLAVVAETAPSVASLRGDVPAALDALVGRMLAKSAADRPRSMLAVIAEISTLQAAFARYGARNALVLSRIEREPEASLPSSADRCKDDAVALTGRARERGFLCGLLEECIEEGWATTLVLTGDAGVGKTHLLDHVRATACSDWACVQVAADASEVGAPFALLRRVVTAALQKIGGDTRAANSMLQALGALDALGACLERDALVVADRLHMAWLELLDAWTSQAAILLLVDNAHEADPASLRFVEEATHIVAERPFAVVLAARVAPAWGQSTERETLSRRGRTHTLALGALPPRASRRLAAQWAPRASARDLDEACRIGAGNPGHLRALCRELESERPLAQASLADLVWARLGALEPEHRRVLRAASIVGRTAWIGAIAAALGCDPTDNRLSEALERLVREGFLSRLPTPELSFAFDSELVQLAAHGLCTDADLCQGHLRVAQWMQENRPFAGVAIGGHLLAGGDRSGAFPYFAGAARAAIAGGQPELFELHFARAVECASSTEAKSELVAVEATGAYWRGHVPQALSAAERGLAELPVGSAAWGRLACLAVTAAGQAGDNRRVLALAHLVLHRWPSAMSPPDASSDVHVIALCRAATQLDAAGLGESTQLQEHLSAVVPERCGEEARAWLARAHATANAHHFDAAIGALVRAHRAHMADGDPRSAAQVGIYLASYYLWSGAWERSRDCIDAARSAARRLNADYLLLWSSLVEAKLEAESGSGASACELLAKVAEQAKASPRMRAGALVYASVAAHRARHFAEARACAEEAVAIAPSPGIRAAALGALCRALLELGQQADAVRQCEAMLGARRAAARVVELEELVWLARIEVALASGALEDAVDAWRSARLAIDARACSLSDPLRRNEYLTRPPIIARLVSLDLDPRFGSIAREGAAL